LIFADDRNAIHPTVNMLFFIEVWFINLLIYLVESKITIAY